MSGLAESSLPWLRRVVAAVVPVVYVDPGNGLSGRQRGNQVVADLLVTRAE
jgi:hypothetical protein